MAGQPESAGGLGNVLCDLLRVLGAAIGVHLWWGGQGDKSARSNDARHVLLWAVVGTSPARPVGYFAWHDPSGPPCFRPFSFREAFTRRCCDAPSFALCSAVGYGYERTKTAPRCRSHRRRLRSHGGRTGPYKPAFRDLTCPFLLFHTEGIPVSATSGALRPHSARTIPTSESKRVAA